jgi:hypothetical protein
VIEWASEPITPAAGAFDPSAMAIGEPGLPAAFEWRGRLVRVESCEARWKKLGAGDGGGGLYLRRHYFRLVMEDGAVWTVYCLRRSAAGSRASRWILYGIGRPEGDPPITSTSSDRT